MENGYTDVCADGTTVIAVVSPPSVIFGNDAPIPLQSYGMFLRARSGSFGHLAIVKAHDTGHALVIDRESRTVMDLGPTYGNYPVGLRIDGTPVILVSGTRYTVGGVPVTIPPGPDMPPATGFLCLDANGDPVWTNLQNSHPISWNGVGVALASIPDGGAWGLGQSRTALTYLAYHVPTSTLYTAAPSENSPIAPTGQTQADGSCILARSLPSGFFASSGFVPYMEEPEPPIDVPTFPATQQRIGVGIFGEPNGPQLISAEEPITSRTKAVFVTLGVDDLDDAADVARAAKLPLICYVDAPVYDQPVPVIAGVDVRAGLQCYPLEGESDSDFRDRIFREGRALIAVGHKVDLIAAAYCQVRGDGTFALTEQQVLNGLRASWDLSRAIQVGAVWCFAWDRGHGLDGLTRWPNIRTAVERMRVASADWTHFPAVPSDPPDPEPPSPSWPQSERFGEDTMQKSWKVGLIGPNGHYYRFDPTLVVGSGGSDVPYDANSLGPHEECVMRKEDDGSFSLISKALTDEHGRSVYVSSGDTSVGVVQTRFERNADETFSVIQNPAGVGPTVLAWSLHKRTNPTTEFMPTGFTVDVRESL